MITITANGKVRPGMLPEMEAIMRSGSCDEGNEAIRFVGLVNSNLTVGRHLRELWSQLKLEVHGDTPPDAIPASCPFKADAGEAGSVRGEVIQKPQHELTKAREDVRLASKLTECKARCAPTRVPQTVQAFLSCDRLSQQFVCVPATASLRISNDAYLECWSVYMGTPSPACIPWVGTRFASVRGKNYLLDEHGNNLVSANLPGGGWRTRHDHVKWTIAALAKWAGLELSCEVLNLFSVLIPRTATFHQEPARSRQGYIPDFLLYATQELADLKCMSVCKSNYPPIRFRHGIRHDAAKVRQNKV